MHFVTLYMLTQTLAKFDGFLAEWRATLHIPAASAPVEKEPPTEEHQAEKGQAQSGAGAQPEGETPAGKALHDEEVGRE